MHGFGRGLPAGQRWPVAPWAVRRVLVIALFAAPAVCLAQDAAETAPTKTSQGETASAPDPEPAVGSLPRHGLALLDWLAIGAYVMLMLVIGWASSRKTKTTEDYLLGGRKLNPSAVGLSLFATLISTISYLAVPGEIIKHGPVFLAYIAAIPIVYLVAGYILIPFIMRLPVTSAYEILEKPLGIHVRLTGSLIFLLTRLVWMGLILFTSAKALVVMLGLPPQTASLLGLAMSLVTILYTSMGGLRASVITGVVQTFVLLAGAVISIVFVAYRMGGVRPWFPTEWAPNWDSQPFFSFDPRVRATVVGMMLTTIAWWICTAGSDQMAIQRYLSTRDAKAARRAFLVNNIADAVTTVVLALLAFALLGFFRAGIVSLPEQYSVVRDADYLFPYFIVNVLPAGIGGMVIAGLLAAAMSSLSAGFSSCCSVVSADFLDRFRKHAVGERQHLRTTKYISTIVGLVVTGLSLLMVWVPGNICEMANKTTNLFVAPLFILFFMAMFVRFATSVGTILGAVYALWGGVVVGYWDVLTGLPGLSWQLVVPSSLLAGVIAGCLFSLLPTRGKDRWTQGLWAAAGATPVVISIAAIFLLRSG